jgi:hypothetical protein
LQRGTAPERAPPLSWDSLESGACLRGGYGRNDGELGSGRPGRPGAARRRGRATPSSIARQI